MTVAFVLQSYAAGGAQRSLLAIAEGVARLGFPVDLVVLDGRGPLRDERPDTARVVELGASGTREAVVPLIRYLRSTRPRVVVSTLENVNVVTWLAHRITRSRSRRIVRAANHMSTSEAQVGRAERALLALAKRAYRTADLAVAPSAEATADLVGWAGVDPTRTEVLPNPVVTDLVTGAADRPVDHPFFGPETRVALAVTRLQPHKGLAELIDAFADVATDADRLLILGEGPQRDELEALAGSHGLSLGPDGVIDLPGFDADPMRFMARCTVFVLASSREGLPGALIQALGAGAPVIATDCPSGPAEVLDGGRHGDLVPVGDSAALRSALSRRLRNPLPGPGPAAVAEYSVPAVLERWTRALERLGAAREEQEP